MTKLSLMIKGVISLQHWRVDPLLRERGKHLPQRTQSQRTKRTGRTQSETEMARWIDNFHTEHSLGLLQKTHFQ